MTERIGRHTGTPPTKHFRLGLFAERHFHPKRAHHGHFVPWLQIKHEARHDSRVVVGARGGWLWAIRYGCLNSQHALLFG